MRMLPEFRYNPHCMENEIFEKVEGKKRVTCECCGKNPEYYCEGMYSREDVGCICPDCIADGSAAKKFDGDFIQDAERIIDDAEKTEELFKRTPGLVTWQGEYWLVCCNDYCAFIAYVGTEELDERGITEEVFADYAEMGEWDVDEVRPYLENGGSMAGYLFRCLHCGKYRIWIDAD